MDRRKILVLFAALVLLALFLLYLILAQSGFFSRQVSPGPGPSVATDVGLLITVILCVSIGFWVTFTGSRAKNWEKALLVVGLILGSGVFWLLSWLPIGLEGWGQAHPAAFNNIFIAGRFMLVIAVIMGVAAFLALILILDQSEREQVKRERRDANRRSISEPASKCSRQP